MKNFKAIAASVGKGIADDALKDEDNGCWLQTLPSETQARWRRRFYCIRWADRLAEQDCLVQPEGRQFPSFYQDWKTLQHQGAIAYANSQWPVLKILAADWFDQSATGHQAEIAAWDEYIEAIADYHQPTLTLNTLQDYEVMLDRLAGSCFQLLPDLHPHQRLLARQFGWVDQFYNNLRDLYEDSQQQVCYFPAEVLAQFGLTRQTILDFSCLNHAGYQSLMEFWVEDYLPTLRQHKLGLFQAKDLQPAWQQLVDWFNHRYRRIETVMRDCHYDFTAFAQTYWRLVEQELSQKQRP
ncbi:MAG: squalene/phytoene synthase family protein [Leptolyngbyaceae cyanobacterium]|mgnify:CR=1 FL=1